MEQLNTYISESLLDDEDDLMDSIDETYKSKVYSWIWANFHVYGLQLTFNKQMGKFVVDAGNVVMKDGCNCDNLTFNGAIFWNDIENNFCINKNSNLKIIDGLPKFCGSIIIEDCENLIKFNDLTDCKSNRLNLVNCHKLKSIEGISIIDEHVYIESCSSLKNLKGLAKTTSYIEIISCDGLTSLSGLSEIAGYVKITDCKSLKTLTHFSKQAREIYIKNNDNLQSLDMTGNYTTIYIRNNNSLKQLNLKSGGISSLILNDNINLKSLNITSKYIDYLKISECKSLEEFQSDIEECKTLSIDRCHKLKSLKGMPKKCKILKLINSFHSDNFVGMPDSIDQVYMENCVFNSFDGICTKCKHMDIKQCGLIITLKKYYKYLDKLS